MLASASSPSPWHACFASAREVTTVLLPEDVSLLTSGWWDSSPADSCFLDISCFSGNNSPSDRWLRWLEKPPTSGLLVSSRALDVLLGLPSQVPSSSLILSVWGDWVRSDVATGEWLEMFPSDGWDIVAVLVSTFSWEPAFKIICLSQFFLLSNTPKKLKILWGRWVNMKWFFSSTSVNVNNKDLSFNQAACTGNNANYS